MLALYRALLRLYPAAYRHQAGEEMISVFRQAQAAGRNRGRGAYLGLCWREVIGLMAGAVDERLRILMGPDKFASLSSRRFAMQPGFRFPKSTAVLMTIILAGVVTAIEQAMSIATSWPHGKAQMPPIQPVRFALFRPFLIPLGLVYGVAALVWVVMFLMRRSGWHRLSALDITR